MNRTAAAAKYLETFGTIFTDDKGRPAAVWPTPPSADATTEDRIAYIRARNETTDAINDTANRAFSEGLRGRL